MSDAGRGAHVTAVQGQKKGIAVIDEQPKGLSDLLRRNIPVDAKGAQPLARQLLHRFAIATDQLGADECLLRFVRVGDDPAGIAFGDGKSRPSNIWRRIKIPGPDVLIAKTMSKFIQGGKVAVKAGDMSDPEEGMFVALAEHGLENGIMQRGDRTRVIAFK